MAKDILKDLNPTQQDAVKHIDGPMLILAGAGSGKTKTITTRLAYLISLGIDPSSILTLTFTNKAAKEMKHRAYSLIDDITIPPLLCTFHKFGLIFLKFHIQKLGRKNNFMIVDTDDKKRILRSLEKELEIPMVASMISKFKNSFTSVEDAMILNDTNSKEVANVYEAYENYLHKNNLVDFDDLLFLPYKLLMQDDKLCEETSKKYNYIMVDEYQDTNELQFKLLQKLCHSHQNISVVGDDDQSIYEWRGATIKNILNFDKEFKDVKIVKLEHNYRSTHEILKYANTLIEHNQDRLGKKLIGTKEQGEKPKVYESFNETLETQKIIRDINALLDNGEELNDMAILYRVNAISRQLEDGLTKASINYKLIGGKRFYERAEIKDLIAYFRTIAEPNDNFSFKRIINQPKRGIGKTTVDKIEGLSKTKNISMFETISQVSSDEMTALIGKKNYRTLKLFEASIYEIQDILKNSKMLFIDHFDDMFEFKQSFKKLFDGEDRIANIDEFYGLLRDYLIKDEKNDIASFLNIISLSSDKEDLDGGAISLMSIHSSKGLEYKHIFVVGLEEGFFPLLNADIQEERRLGYVAFTRAKSSLTVSFVQNRFYKGKRSNLTKSRFLVESGLLKGGFKMKKISSFAKGDAVKHNLFGLGTIEMVKPAGSLYKLKINFGGNKREIMSSFVTKL
ncbi:MAG: ATP-dependent DNA helicase [Campylobacteraceae bacterium 4484_166]|nr:MAG: ATP-dependent DNA helicase [Campylobacteraceae bacterium 4484_166]